MSIQACAVSVNNKQFQVVAAELESGRAYVGFAIAVSQHTHRLMVAQAWSLLIIDKAWSETKSGAD